MPLPCSTCEQQIKEQREQEVMLASEVDLAKQRMHEINGEMQKVIDQLGEAKVDRHESSRAQRKAELIDNLQRLFPGVVSDTISFGHRQLLHQSIVVLAVWSPD